MILQQVAADLPRPSGNAIFGKSRIAVHRALPDIKSLTPEQEGLIVDHISAFEFD